MQPEWKKVGVISKFLTSTPAGKIYLGMPRRRWEDSIRMNLKEIGVSTSIWIDSSQDRDQWRALVNVALNGRDP